MHTHDLNSSNVPAFLIKLWRLVEDPSCDDLIAWSDSGGSFIIKDQARFASELLPQYFKHNNMASFIRQLNMYGFRKVMNYEKSGLRTDNNEMEFQHSFFLKEQSELLEHIKRKIPNARIIAEPHSKSNATTMLTDLTSIRDKQENMNNMLMKMKQENELLWKELTNMRQKHKHQEQVIEKVIQFLVQIIRNQPVGVGIQRKIPRMLHDSPGSKGNSSQITTLDILRNKPECLILKDKNSTGPVIHEITEYDVEEPLSINSSAKHTTSHLTVNSPASQLSVRSPSSQLSVNSPTPALSVRSPASVNSPSPAPPSASSVNEIILSNLEPLQTNSEAMTREEDDSILGIPLDYITTDIASTLKTVAGNNGISIPKDNIIRNVISIPEGSNISNVNAMPPENNALGNIISITEGSDISNVISIPEGSDISNVISIPEGSDISNVINISEGSDISNVISIPEGSDISHLIGGNQNSPDGTTTEVISIPNAATGKLPKNNSEALTLTDLYTADDLKDNTSNPEKNVMLKHDFEDPLMSDSLQTPRINLADDFEFVDFPISDSKFQSNSITELAHTLNLSEDQHNCSPSTSGSNGLQSSAAKNTLSNHLLIVDEELNRFQDNISSKSWDADMDKILGLFGADGIVSNEAIVNEVTGAITIKKEPVDMLDNDLNPLTPQILGVNLEHLQSPFLDPLGPEIAVNTDNAAANSEEKFYSLTDDTINENVTDVSEYFDIDTGASVRRKNSKDYFKGKRRKLK